MSQPMSAGVSPYVPRGPVAHEIHALRLTIIFISLYVTLIVGFGAFFMVKAFNRVDSAATTATKIQTLQQQTVDNSTTGRAILLQQTALSKLIAQQTSPTATAVQQGKIADILNQLTAGIKTLNADQLRKLGELAVVLGAPPSAVQRILSEPVPVITFGPPAVATPAPGPSGLPAARPSSASRASPTPAPSPTLTPAVQIQCLPICPPTK